MSEYKGRTQLLCAIAVSLWSAVAAGGQATGAGALSAPLRAHLQGERFDIVTSIRGLPLGVRNTLETLFGSGGLDIAEPGAEFQMTKGAVDPKLPTRRLAAAWCSTDHCFVYYERGGSAHTWHAALFHWTPAGTKLEGGGVAPAGLATTDAVRNLILTGATKAGSW